EEDLDLVEPARVLWGEDEAPAWMLGEPVAHFLSRPRREVVADRDHFPAGGDLALELIEGAEQVEAVAGLRGHRGHLSRGDPQRREQVLGAVPAVLVLAPRRLAGPRLHVGARRRLRLYARLLVDRDDQRPLRRVEVEPAHLGGLGVEVGAEVTHQPLLEQMRLDLGRTQDLVRLRFRHPDRLRELAVRPALAPQPPSRRRGPRAGERDQLRSRPRPVHERPPRTRRVHQPGQALRLEAAAPLPDRPLRAANLASDPHRRPPLPRGQHDPAPARRLPAPPSPRGPAPPPSASAQAAPTRADPPRRSRSVSRSQPPRSPPSSPTRTTTPSTEKGRTLQTRTN